MPEQTKNDPDQGTQERAYRDFFRNKEGCIITLGDLFDAVEQDQNVAAEVNKVLSKTDPITVLVEGSAFEQNMDVLDKVIAGRANSDDRIVLVDISSAAVKEHSKYFAETFPDKKYRVVQGDMNHIPLSDASVDLLINDCAVNFNTTRGDNEQTVKEARRLLKPDRSVCLFSAAVNKDYDDPQYGQNQELIPSDEVNKQGFFYPLPDQSFTRGCWPVPYYKNLFAANGFEAMEFDIDKGKSFFPPDTKISYRRILLTPKSSDLSD
jgi:hypothetical protein